MSINIGLPNKLSPPSPDRCQDDEDVMLKDDKVNQAGLFAEHLFQKVRCPRDGVCPNLLLLLSNRVE